MKQRHRDCRFPAKHDDHPSITFQLALSAAFGIDPSKKSSIDVRVDKAAYINFLKRFGPLRLCTEKIVRNLFDSKTGELNGWFHGEISAEAGENIIADHLVGGSYFVRYSDRNPGLFTIVRCVLESGGKVAVKKHLVYNHGDSGYGLKPDVRSCGKDLFWCLPGKFMLLFFYEMI